MFFQNNRNRYTLYGALFGLSFPIISFLIIALISSNIWVLFSVICTAPLFLGIFARFAGVRQDKLNDINQGLEKIIEDRTRAIKNMLDVTGQGFLSFGDDLKINKNYSRKCEEILYKDLAGLKVNDLLFEDEEKRNDFKDGFNLYFSGKARDEVIYDLMEKEIYIDEKTVKVEFRTISESEVLCILTDITVEKILQKKMETDSENKNIMLQVISNRKYFASFVQEAEKLFEYMSLIEETGTETDYETLQRNIHTFKGNASFFSFNRTKERAHELEFYINDSLILEEDINLEDQSLVLKKAYFSELGIIRETFGEQWIKDLDNISIPRKNYLKLEKYIEGKYGHDRDLNHAIKHFRKVPLENMFARFPDMADRLAGTLGKRIKQLTIQGGTMEVLPDRFEGMVNSFVHLIRNMVDHGIESPRERESLNKNPEGVIKIEIDDVKEGIQIIFADDGRGISFSDIQKKAMEKGLVSSNKRHSAGELIKMIFLHNFSTAGEVTDISGRGAGLSAVKKEVDKLKGRISVTTKQNQGTTFKILIPDLN